jgi:hypothetical protein
MRSLRHKRPRLYSTLHIRPRPKEHQHAGGRPDRGMLRIRSPDYSESRLGGAVACYPPRHGTRASAPHRTLKPHKVQHERVQSTMSLHPATSAVECRLTWSSTSNHRRRMIPHDGNSSARLAVCSDPSPNTLYMRDLCRKLQREPQQTSNRSAVMGGEEERTRSREKPPCTNNRCHPESPKQDRCVRPDIEL